MFYKLQCKHKRKQEKMNITLIKYLIAILAVSFLFTCAAEAQKISGCRASIKKDQRAQLMSLITPLKTPPQIALTALPHFHSIGLNDYPYPSYPL